MQGKEKVRENVGEGVREGGNCTLTNTLSSLPVPEEQTDSVAADAPVALVVVLLVGHCCHCHLT